MADYYALLERIIKETVDDPGKIRQVVYEASRLALKRQILLQRPPITIQYGKRLLNDLEDAIARCEADFANSSHREPTNLEVPETREAGSERKRRDDSDGVEDGQAITGANRAAREDGKADGVHASRTNSQYLFAESKKNERLQARPVYDRRMTDSRSDVRAADHDDRRPMHLDEDEEAAAGNRQAAREKQKAVGTDARRANDRNAFVDPEEDEGRTTQPTSDRRAHRDSRSGLGSANDREPSVLDEDEEGVARTIRAGRDVGNASVTHAPRANGRSSFAESEEDKSPPTRARSIKDGHAARPVDEEFRAANRRNRASEVNADDRSDPHLDGAVEHRRQPRNRFKYPPSSRVEDRNASLAEAEDESPPSRARPTNDRPIHPGSEFDEDAGRPMKSEFRAADRYDPARDPGEDDGSDPPQEDVFEPPKRPRNRFEEPPSGPAEDWCAPSRELVPAPNRSYMFRPDALPPSADKIYEVPPRPLKGFVSMLRSAAWVLFQVTFAALAATAFYVAVWQRNISQPPQDAALAAATQSAPAPAAFPYPTSYGIYAISNNQLIELEKVPTAPVDPRTRSTLQIVKPSRTVIADPHLTFLAFRRDLVSNAPEKVPVRVAARIAHSMIFESGKPVVTTSATETWLIRDEGYDLRVAPVRENAEMVTLRPEDPDFAFPAGRFELLIGGQHYDFVVAGAVSDPAQCVEGVATVRGPIFYECKTK
jgi:hypothetical protein